MPCFDCRSSRLTQLSQASCGRLSWNGLSIQRFAPIFITEDVTDTIHRYLSVTKHVGQVLKMSHDGFEAVSCVLSFLGVSLQNFNIGNHIPIVDSALRDVVIV